MLSGAKYLWLLAPGSCKTQKKSEILRFAQNDNKRVICRCLKFYWRLLRFGFEFWHVQGCARSRAWVMVL